MKEQELRKLIRESLEESGRPSEKEFNEAIKDIMVLIPPISHDIIHDNNLPHDEEIVIRLNQEILQNIKKGNKEMLDKMWEKSWSRVLKYAINTISHYTEKTKSPLDNMFKGTTPDDIDF